MAEVKPMTSYQEMMARAKSSQATQAINATASRDKAAQKQRAEYDILRAKKAEQEALERKAREDRRIRELEEAQRKTTERLKEQLRLKERAANAKAALEAGSPSGGSSKDRTAQAVKSDRIVKREKRMRKLFEDDDAGDDLTGMLVRASKGTTSKMHMPHSAIVKKTSAVPDRKGSSSAAGGTTLPRPRPQAMPSNMTSKARLLASYDTGAVALNQQKRDKRTIEEIEMDMRARRGGGNSALSRQSSVTSTSSRAPSISGQASSSKSAASSTGGVGSGLASLSFKPKPVTKSTPAVERSGTKKAVSLSSVSERNSSSPHKRKRTSYSDSEDDEHTVGYRPGAIYALMGRNYHRDSGREKQHWSDDEDDMEADVHFMEDEERIAERDAAREDRIEKIKLERAAAEKAKRLAGIKMSKA